MVAAGVEQLLRQIQVPLTYGQTDALDGGIIAAAVAVAAVAAVGAAIAAAVGSVAIAGGAALALVLDLLVGLVDLLHLLLCQIGQGIIVIIIGMVLFGQIPIGFFDFLVCGGAGDTQHLIGITHRRVLPFVQGISLSGAADGRCRSKRRFPPDTAPHIPHFQ